MEVIKISTRIFPNPLKDKVHHIIEAECATGGSPEPRSKNKIFYLKLVLCSTLRRSVIQESKPHNYTKENTKQTF